MEVIMSKIRKAVIPVAGYGTGFLPATKAQPKELLPIVDKPIIQFTVEEALASGIEEIVIITGRHKRPVEDHFDSNPELEENLLAKGKMELLELVKDTTLPDLFFVRQPYPLGLADAIRYAKPFIGDEPFALLLADNIFESEVPVMKQLMDVYDQHEVSTVAALHVDDDQVDQYGIIEKAEETLNGDQSLYPVASLTEKPKKDEAHSNIAVAGRYILTPDIFDIIDNMEPTPFGKFDLTDAMNQLNQTQRVFAKEVTAERFDVGDKLGYMRMSMHYGLGHPETKDELKTYLIDLAKKL